MKTTVAIVGSVLGTLVLVGTCSLLNKVTDSVVLGDCVPANRVATRDTYNSLALRIVYGRLSGFQESNATPSTVSEQLGRIGGLRTEASDKVTDKCLLQEVYAWLDYYEREARGAIEKRRRLNGYSSEYEKTREEKEDKIRALSEYLRVSPL